jgi:hypothetical protein
VNVQEQPPGNLIPQRKYRHIFILISYFLQNNITPESFLLVSLIQMNGNLNDQR